jgi:hypothetical protein
MVIDNSDDLLAFLVFVARVANPIAPFLAKSPCVFTAGLGELWSVSIGLYGPHEL